MCVLCSFLSSRCLHNAKLHLQSLMNELDNYYNKTNKKNLLVVKTKTRHLVRISRLCCGRHPHFFKLGRVIILSVCAIKGLLWLKSLIIG
jgi:hypothetical protein